MSNPYFQFKQFTVWHDKCAMKAPDFGHWDGNRVGSFNVGATQFAGCKYCSVGNR